MNIQQVQYLSNKLNGNFFSEGPLVSGVQYGKNAIKTILNILYDFSKSLNNHQLFQTLRIHIGLDQNIRIAMI